MATDRGPATATGPESPNADPQTTTSSEADVWVGVGLVVLGAVVLVELWQAGRSIWSISGPGPAFFPGLLALVLFGLAAAMAIRARAASTAGGAVTEVEQASPIRRTGGYALAVAGMVVLFPLIGGLAAIAVFVLGEMIAVERQPVLRAVIASAAVTFTVWFLFVFLLGVRLPFGVFAGVMR